MGADFFDNLLKMTFRILNVPNKFRVDLMFVSRDSIKQYNAEKRGVNKVTDVLSFPAIDYKEPLIPEDITTVRFLKNTLKLSMILRSFTVSNEDVASSKISNSGFL